LTKETGDWRFALRSSDVNPDFFVYRPKDLNEQLPWDFIDHGIKKLVTTQVVRFKVHRSGVQLGAINHCPCQDSSTGL